MLMLMLAAVPLSALQTKAAAAEGNEALKNARSGVLTVKVGLKENGSKNIETISMGSGFLIGSVDKGQYVITCNHVVDVENLKAEYAKEKKKNVKNLKTIYQIVGTTSGLEWTATLKRNSPEKDFAILQLDEKIYNCEPLTLSDDEYVTETQEVYALGYPWVVTQYGQDFSRNKDADVTITNGIINKFQTLGGIKYIVHTSKIEQGSSGGPLVDEDGNVVGINAARTDDQYYFSIQINIVKEALDALGYEYKKIDPDPEPEPSTGDEPTTEVKPQVDKSELESNINKAEEYKKDDYTEDSFANLENKLNEAKEVFNNAEATQAEVNTANSNLADAMKDDVLKKKSGFPIILVIIAVIVVLLIIALIILLSSRSKKKKKEAMNSSAGGYGPRPTPGPVPTPVPTPGPAPVPGPAPAPRPSPSYYGEGAGETSVLNEGAGETTILSGASSIQASLFRESNSENVKINKSVFSIGKERMKVDYCISDNNSVSRNHAEIIIKGGKFYIVDQRSKNGTYVNDVRIDPLQEVEIKGGDRLRLSDEEFVFRTM